jgi:Peptidase family M28
MRLEETVGTLHGAFDVEASLADIAELVKHDRYPASDGINQAAAYVADRAVAAGLTDVEVLQYPADGTTRWWTFQAPTGWTPRHASLALCRGAERRTVVEYPRQPHSLAAHSAGTAPDGATGPLLSASRQAPQDWPRGCIVLLDAPDLPWSTALAMAERRGVAGVVACTAARTGAGPDAVGRLELPPGTGLFAFSVTSAQLAELLAASRTGGWGLAVVRAERAPSMPVVTGLLPGRVVDELLVVAHLCHPAQSANDNASGVAAALGVGRLLAHRRRRRGIRILWGPEFAGLAAYLATGLPKGAAHLPLAAINLDMAGEDQRRCGGPLIVERSPDHLPSFLNALVEGCVQALPQAGRSYAGTVPCDTWTWRATPFVGASDHALLADRSVGCPAVQFGHWPDRFNHSSADTLDKVDPEELRRVAGAAAGALAVLADAEPGDVGELERLVLRWGATGMLDCLSGAGERPARRGGWIDPFAPAWQRDRLAHRHRVAVGSLEALRALHDAPCRRPGAAERWLDGLSDHVRGMLPLPAKAATADADDPAKRPLGRGWIGPFNLHALIAAAERLDRDWLQERLDRDRGRWYATMMAIAQAIDGASGREAVLRRAAFSSELPIEIAIGHRFLEALARAGWMTEGHTAGGVATVAG